MKLKGRILRSGLSRGYFMVCLYKNGISQTIKVHKLVAEAFLTRIKGQQVRHGSNGKLDNSIANLSYGTQHEDGLDKRRDGTHGGRSVRRSDGVEFISMAVAAEETGCCHTSNISAVCNGKQRTVCNYNFTYID